ncbi:MAG: 2-oxoglutarate dehydrogenase [Gammaproteobacteria bacterium RIFCSPHIGHO2_02_FULL_39_13]|nr:MAG: 2-oxoglutarate dehydrogenase [Gammaproteobacteria bacterium RIFCSPHIGHO2_02_FULL_39_13]OGT49280.1 MAG: 2-oxoglutarate dehydrogenase [Gammaproteobacteria bacterium RIFCSPHIGHO2_12_FULL_39_24]
MIRAIEKYALLICWFIALIAMLSTLFASEVLHWPVCSLCWYQRIAIYPMVLLLGMAAYRNETNIISYVIPFSVIGFLFAVYQYLEQMIPGFAPIDFCTPTVPCDVTHLKLFGFITIPFLSALACLIIFLLLLVVKRSASANDRNV